MMPAATDSHGCLRSALLIVLLEMALASAGCASPGASGGNASQSASPGAVTGEELRQVSARDTYEALKQLRPIWLLPRGAVVPRVLFGGETGSVSIRDSARGGQLPPGDRSQ